MCCIMNSYCLCDIIIQINWETEVVYISTGILSTVLLKWNRLSIRAHSISCWADRLTN